MRKGILSDLSSAGYASENFCQIMLLMVCSKTLGALRSEFGCGDTLLSVWIDKARIRSRVECGK